MPSLLLYILRVYPYLNQQRDPRMSQVMESNPSEPHLSE